MSTIALDSNAVRAVRSLQPAILRTLADDSPALPSAVVLEAVEGWIRLKDRHDRSQDELGVADALGRLVDFLEFSRDLPILDYNDRARDIYASLRAGRGNRSRADLRIAAICIAHATPLLTRNVRDFEDLPGLVVRTW